MFLKQALNRNTEIWRYISILLLAFGLNLLASVPAIIVIALKLSAQGGNFVPGKTGLDLTQYGLSQNMGLLVILAPLIIVFAGLTVGIKSIHGFSWTQVFTSFSRFRWRNFFVSGLLWFVLLAFVELISYMLKPDNYSFYFKEREFFILLVISLIFFPFQASWEELYFRGNFMQGIAVATKTRYWPLITSSILFGLAHIFNPEVKEFGMLNASAQYIGFGLMLGVLVIMDGGLEMAFGVHTMNNIFAASIVSYEGSVIQAPSLISSHEINPTYTTIAMYITAILFLLLLKHVFKWKSFRWIFEPV
jgi:membrane protease YdiL (CAAX protease family)